MPADQVLPLERSRRWEGLLRWILRCSARTPQDPGPLPCPSPPFPPHSCLPLCHQPQPKKLLGPSLNILPRAPMTGLCGYKGQYLASIQNVSEGAILSSELQMRMLRLLLQPPHSSASPTPRLLPLPRKYYPSQLLVLGSVLPTGVSCSLTGVPAIVPCMPHDGK